MTLKVQNPNLVNIIQNRYTLAEIQELISCLEKQGTFEFPVLPTGLFSAAITNAETEYTGYQQVWVRDNIHIAHAHYVIGQTDIFCNAAIALMTYFTQHRDRFDNIIAQPDLAQQAMNRPHIRFDGTTLTELDQRWSHAQNDALGYFLWFYCKLVNEGYLSLKMEALEILSLFPRYFRAIEYWQDADQGHWEEKAKVEASSIGTVVAGLREFQLMGFRVEEISNHPQDIGIEALIELIETGERALAEILPYECRHPKEQQRRTDAALLFLIYPLGVVDTAIADQIIQDVVDQLQGEIGIKRYLLDSFWAPDYKAKVAPEKRTMEMSEDMAERDVLAQPGKEAQWCIFDPILSTIYGHRYHISGDDVFLTQQINYLNRSLGQLTDENCPSGAYKCPELYYLEDGGYIPNDATPLLWTQANLRVALQTMVESLSR